MECLKYLYINYWPHPSTKNATHLIKVAVEAAVGKRSGIEVYGTDYNTVDGTAVRDYIHVADVVAADIDALRYLRNGGTSMSPFQNLIKGYRAFAA
jgi:UDP-glucose 4-epimerase